MREKIYFISYFSSDSEELVKPASHWRNFKNKFKFYQENGSWNGLSTAKKYKSLNKAYKNLIRLQNKTKFKLHIRTYNPNRYGYETEEVDLKLYNLLNQM